MFRTYILKTQLLGLLRDLGVKEQLALTSNTIIQRGGGVVEMKYFFVVKGDRIKFSTKQENKEAIKIVQKIK